MKTFAFDVNPEEFDLFEEADMAVEEFEDSSEEDYDDDYMDLMPFLPPPGPPPELVDVQTQCDLMEDTAVEELLFEVGLPPEAEDEELTMHCDCLKCEQHAVIFE